MISKSIESENRVGLTVDLEFLDAGGREYSSQNTSKYEKEGIRELLQILRKHGRKITFFTTANLCNEHLDFLKKIKKEGHEIASHSLSHKKLNDISYKEIKKEINDSKKILEENLDIEIKGFRSPLLKHERRVFEEVEKAGYVYDSSMLPSIKIPGWYGGDDVSISPFKISNNLIEFPLSINPFLKLPISGFFIRLFGRKYLFWSIRQLHDKGIIPIIYVHPFELRSFGNKNNWRQKLRTGEYMIKTLEDMARSYRLFKLEKFHGLISNES